MRSMLLGAVFAVAVLAQAEGEAKPLKAGDAVPKTYRAFLAADSRYEKESPKNRVRKMHDLVTDNGLNPVLAVFARTVPANDAPVAKLARAMSGLVTKFKPERLGAFLMFLTLDKEYPEEENRDPKAAAAADLNKALDSGNVPFALAARESDATKSWSLTPKDEVVVIYYDRLVIKKVWTFAADKPPTDEDIKAIQSYVTEELKPKR